MAAAAMQLFSDSCTVQIRRKFNASHEALARDSRLLARETNILARGKIVLARYKIVLASAISIARVGDLLLARANLLLVFVFIASRVIKLAAM